MQAPTNILMGLTTTEVQERLQKYGPNVVPQRQFSFRHAVIVSPISMFVGAFVTPLLLGYGNHPRGFLKLPYSLKSCWVKRFKLVLLF